MPSSTRRRAPKADTSRASIRGAQPPRSPHPNPPPLAGKGMGGGSGRDEAVDLAVAEQPLAALLDQFVAIAAARADLWPLRTVLRDGPVGAHPRARAVERDRDIGHQVNPARPLFAR